MKNNITEMVFILDKSGSMGGLEEDTIGGFNAMIEKQKKTEGTCFVSTVLFNHEIDVIHDRIPLEEVPKLNDREYSVGGCTALTDAIGGAVSHVKKVHRYIRPEDVPEHTVFVITTDGLENASKQYSSGEVKRMIEEAQKERGWEFVFVGANIDAVETAAQYSIRPERTVNYHSDKGGTKALYGSIDRLVRSVRSCGKVAEDWCAEITADNESRQ